MFGFVEQQKGRYQNQIFGDRQLEAVEKYLADTAD
jgi:hypothetical protein